MPGPSLVQSAPACRPLTERSGEGLLDTGRKSLHRFVFGVSTVVFLAYFMREIVSPVAGIGVIILLLTAGCSESTDYAQPIAYNHATHIQEVGMECIDCHIQAETHQKASIPNIALCIECHEEALTESMEEEKLVTYIQEDQTIPWVQVHRVPDHAYFSHRRHVAMGKISCEQCHGQVTEMTLPFTKPAFQINMNFCIQCHKNNQVSTECADCHR